MIIKILDKILISPFINLLKQFISYGCDPHQPVQKKKKYREIERLRVEAVSEVDLALLKQLEEGLKGKVKKRDEVLAGR